MPSIADLLGFVRSYLPWNTSFPSPNSFPYPPDSGHPPNPAQPPWLQAIGAFSSSGAPTFYEPATPVTWPVSGTSGGGLLGGLSFPPIEGGTDQTSNTGILQDLYTDPIRGTRDTAADGLLGPVIGKASTADLPGFFSPQVSPSPPGAPPISPFDLTGSGIADPSLGLSLGFLPTDSIRPADLFNSGSAFPTVPGGLPNTSDPDLRDDLPDNGPRANADSSRDGLSSSERTPQTQNDPAAASADTRDPQTDKTASSEEAGSDASLSQSFDRAQATIAADPELAKAALMAERAGDKTFRDRLASIIVDLDRNPEEARNAIWREVYASGSRSNAFGSAANAFAAFATKNAATRLEELRPNLGVGWASDDAQQALNELNRDQQQAFYRIAANPNLTPAQKLERMANEGFVDSALASSPLGEPFGLLHTLAGGSLGPAAAAIGGGPGRRDPRRWPDSGFDLETPKILPAADIIRLVRNRRYIPGIASGAGVKIDGLWQVDEGAPVPAQVADLLRGRRFSDFHRFREAFWKAVESVPELAVQFSPSNRVLMSRGRAPKVKSGHDRGQIDMYQLHHDEKINDNGEVYNADNIIVVTPKVHHEIHYGRKP